MKRTVVISTLMAILVMALSVSVALAKPACGPNSTVVTGMCDRYDTDNNGYPDAGITVVGHYTSVYAYDATGNWYWNLGDGRVQGTVGSVNDLDQATLTVCNYQIQYRAKFENNPFMDSGSIQNMITCRGFDDNGSYHYQIVHQSDPRYTGNPEWAEWGTWEYHVLTESHNGNLVHAQPEHAVGN